LTGGNGHALPGECRRVDREPIDADEEKIGRNPVSGRERDNVAYHDAGGINGSRFPVTDDHDVGRQQLTEAFGRAFGPRFLNEREHAV